MNKSLYNECISNEIYARYADMYKKRKLSILDILIARYFIPSFNSVLLIRKMQYLYSKGGYSKVLAYYYRHALMRKYGMHISPTSEIGIGLHVEHPSCIVMTDCHIGNNFTIYHGCTIGQKNNIKHDSKLSIGDNVVLYCNSSIIGNCTIADNVVIGAHSLVLNDCEYSGMYAGNPAKLIKQI